MKYAPPPHPHQYGLILLELGSPSVPIKCASLTFLTCRPSSINLHPHIRDVSPTRVCLSPGFRRSSQAKQISNPEAVEEGLEGLEQLHRERLRKTCMEDGGHRWRRRLKWDLAHKWRPCKRAPTFVDFTRQQRINSANLQDSQLKPMPSKREPGYKTCPSRVSAPSSCVIDL